jgi:hypothetical protein
VRENNLLNYELLGTPVHANKKNAVFAALQKVRNAPRHVANSAGLIRFFVDYFMRHTNYEYCSAFLDKCISILNHVHTIICKKQTA